MSYWELMYFFFVYNVQVTKKMHFNIHDVFYPQFSHQHVSADFAAIFIEMLLLENKYQLLAVLP